jgi:ABC-2 type transport system ATP-binding protein
MTFSDRAIAVHQMRVVRGGREILHDLDFDVAAGRITGLVGPSGCGKTTLMRVLAGTQRVVGGRATIFGKVAGHQTLRGRIGYAPQAASVYDDLTVTQNVRYFATEVRADHDEVDRVLAAVDMARLEHHVVGRLSGGERSRVSLAVAMLGRPRLLVLDEPTVGLDPVLRESLWQLFHRLAADGAAVLVSSHVMDEAERCDELLLMRDGRLLAQDTPPELMRRSGTDSMEDAFLRLVEDVA